MSDLNEIYGTLHSDFLNILKRFSIGGVTEEEDYIQDFYIHLSDKSFDNVNGGNEGFKKYLRRAFRNFVYKKIRRDSRNSEKISIATREFYNVNYDDIDKTASELREFEENERVKINMLYAAIRSLPPIQRRVMDLYAVRNMPDKEIAMVLNTSVVKVQKNKSRAISTLKNVLSGVDINSLLSGLIIN